MNIDHLVRDKTKIHAALKEVNNTLVAVKPCKIYIPDHYVGAELGNIAEDISIVGIYGIAVDDKYYGVSNACALLQIEPSSSNTVEINGTKYMEFYFDVNDKVVKNLNLIRLTTLVYRIYVEIISKGKVPWYLSYHDVCFIFDTALSHGNVDLMADSAMLELLASVLARQRSDKSKFFRHLDGLKDTDLKTKPTYVALKSVQYQSTNTVAKLMGNYFSEGLSAALVHESTTNESIETLLRS